MLHRPAAALVIQSEEPDVERIDLGIAQPAGADPDMPMLDKPRRLCLALLAREQAACWQLDGAELGPVAERVDAHGAPADVHPPEPASEVQHLVIHVHPPARRQRGRQRQLASVSCLRREAAQHEAAPAVDLGQLGSDIPLGRAVGLVGEEAHAVRGGLVRAVEVREAEQLAGDRVADAALEPPVDGLERGDLEQHLDREVQVRQRMDLVAGLEGVQEEEAVAARGEEAAAHRVHVFAVVPGGLQVEGPDGDGNGGGGGGRRERGGHGYRGSRQLRLPVHHYPGRPRGGGGQGTAEAAGGAAEKGQHLSAVEVVADFLVR